MIGQGTAQATAVNHSQDFRESRFSVVLDFYRECWNPVKSHSKALVFFAVSKKNSCRIFDRPWSSRNNSTRGGNFKSGITV